MIKTSIKYGWERVKENMQISLLSTLLMLALGAISGGGKGLTKSLLGILAAVFLIIVRIGYTKIFLRLSDGESPKFNEIFSEYSLFWKYLWLSILMGLAIGIGLILVIIPGIILAVRLSFAPIIIVDTKMGAITSMKESWAITQGSFWKLLWFWVVITLLNVIGIIPFGLGLLITIPMSMFASIYIYRELSKSKAGVAIAA